MARNQQNGMLRSTANAVGDTANAAVKTTSGAVRFTQNTFGFVRSLVNRDGGVGAAIGLAVGAGVMAFVGIPGGIFAGMSALAATTTVACCGAATGLVAGGTAGKRRIAKEHTHGKTIKEPTLINKTAIAGLSLGAAGQAVAMTLVPAGAPIIQGLALAGTSILPAAGGYIGGRMGANRMGKEYETAHGVKLDKKSASNDAALQHEHTHPAQRSYKNAVAANDPAWLEAKSLMRDSNTNPGQGSHAAKLLADRAAAQQAVEQHQAE